MTLDDETKAALTRSLEAHSFCGHESSQLCYTMVLVETEIRRERELSDDDIEACKAYIADQVLEGLILKGLVEVTGIDNDGEFYVGLTDAGEQAYQNVVEEIGEDDRNG